MWTKTSSLNNSLLNPCSPMKWLKPPVDYWIQHWMNLTPIVKVYTSTRTPPASGWSPMASYPSDSVCTQKRVAKTSIFHPTTHPFMIYEKRWRDSPTKPKKLLRVLRIYWLVSFWSILCTRFLTFDFKGSRMFKTLLSKWVLRLVVELLESERLIECNCKLMPGHGLPHSNLLEHGIYQTRPTSGFEWMSEVRRMNRASSGQQSVGSCKFIKI